MAWSLKGSYAETCSCELMCPCNLTLDHGATYDYCRATLGFHIREGEIEGTDVGGLNLVAIVDSPKVMSDGGWRLGVFVDGDGRAGREAGAGLQRAVGRPDGGTRTAGGRDGRCRAGAHRDPRRRPAPYRPRRRRDRLRGPGHRALRRRGRPARAIPEHVPPRRVRPDDGRGPPVEHQRLRHPV